ncbi:MAG: hypothetical protein JXA13_01055 [Anaerolineales bacterium]|nr:hypothetical protein [Anaerolineales bacterium]
MDVKSQRDPEKRGALWGKHRPDVARNGYAEQRTRLVFSSTDNGAGNQPQAQTGEIAQDAKAPGITRGYADVGTEYRKARVLDEQRSCTCTWSWPDTVCRTGAHVTPMVVYLINFD